MTTTPFRRSTMAWATMLACTLGIASPARAAEPTLSDCLAANEQSIQLRADHKLRPSRDKALVCAAKSCPRAVRDVCERRVTDLASAIPTLVFEAKDAGGHDLSAVTVTMDGQPLVARLDGSPVAVDPGEHDFVFESPELGKVTKHIVVYEGDKARQEPVLLGPPPPITSTVPPDGTVAPVATPAPSRGMGTQKLIGLTAGGVGVAGLVVGSVFGGLTFSAWSSAKSACGAGGTSHCVTSNPSTVTSDKSTAQNDGTISTIAFIAGGVLVAGGAALFLTGGHAEAGSSPGASVALAPAVGPQLMGLMLQGDF